MIEEKFDQFLTEKDGVGSYLERIDEPELSLFENTLYTRLENLGFWGCRRPSFMYDYL